MRKVKGIFLFTACLLIACGCGAQEEGNGRYVETPVELPEDASAYGSLVQNQDQICLTGNEGCDYLLEINEGEISFNEAVVAEIPGGLEIRDIAVSPEGDRLVTWGDGTKWDAAIFTKEGEKIEISNIGDTEILYPYYCGGYFYISQSDRVYQLDSSTGSAQLLLDGVGVDEPYYMASDGELLYVVYGSRGRSLVIYDLEKGAVAGEDAVLEAFLKKSFIYRNSSPYGAPYEALFYPVGEKIYVLDNTGIYRHTLYGEDMELVVDGSLCTIGAADREYTGMAVEERKKPVFLVGYADGRLMKYTYDPDAPEPVTLSVYSLYESDNIRTLIREFRKVHPEITVEYKIGYSDGTSLTIDDALKNIATEMAAGTAADILVMDDIPYRSYKAKGALMDLTSLREGMADSEYYTNVLDGFTGEDGIYTIPMAFAVPILAGKSEDIDGVETLEDLADVLEERRRDLQNGESLINMFFQSYKSLNLLGQTCQGAWIGEDGGLDMEAVKEFLTQGKRIYDAQMENIAEELLLQGAILPKAGENEWDYPTKSIITRRFGPYADGAAQAAGFHLLVVWQEQPFFAGYLSSMGGDFPYFIVELEAAGFDYCMMPGQKYGTCLATDMLSVNQATEHSEECMTFLEYAFSEEFQRDPALDGTPVNRAANWSRREDYWTYDRIESPISEDGQEFHLRSFVPSDEIYAKFDKLLEEVNGVNYCEAKVFDIVMNEGVRVADGDCTVDEAVKEIERQLKLYLEE